MIGLDTNIVVRLITNDDRGQVARARAAIVKEGGFILDTIVMETVWVLRKTYGFSPRQIDHAFGILLETDVVELENPNRLRRALTGVKAGLSFEDAFHLAGCKVAQFATFDDALVKRAPRAFTTPTVFEPANVSGAG